MHRTLQNQPPLPWEPWRLLVALTPYAGPLHSLHRRRDLWSASRPSISHFFTWLTLVSLQITANIHCSLIPKTGLQSQDFSHCMKIVCGLVCSLATATSLQLYCFYSQHLAAPSFVTEMNKTGSSITGSKSTTSLGGFGKGCWP